MKLKYALPLVLLCNFTGPVLADSASAATQAENCSLIGPLPGASEECQARRAAYRAEFQLCVDRLRDEARALVRRPVGGNYHVSQARYLICNAAARKKLGLVSN